MKWYIVVLSNAELQAGFDGVLAGLFDKRKSDAEQPDQVNMYILKEEEPSRTFYLSSPSYETVRPLIMIASGSICDAPSMDRLQSIYDSQRFMGLIARVRKASPK